MVSPSRLDLARFWENSLAYLYDNDTVMLRRHVISGSVGSFVIPCSFMSLLALCLVALTLWTMQRYLQVNCCCC